VFNHASFNVAMSRSNIIYIFKVENFYDDRVTSPSELTGCMQPVFGTFVFNTPDVAFGIDLTTDEVD
jgi:hypothetical protein